MATAQESKAAKAAERGIGYWMARVLAEREKAGKGLAVEAVHDLRVALRRCRSMAEGFQQVDGDPVWPRMRAAGKALFSALGDLRDTQVLLEWVERLKDASPPVAERLRVHCQRRESELKVAAAQALMQFDVRRWSQWTRLLEERTQRLANCNQVFQVLALARYREARVLHSTALRNRTRVALHELRIGIKRFRYLVENFLPEHHQRWGQDLKRLQDSLGEVHDLDVLADTARQADVFGSPDQKQQWNAAATREREQRVREYRTRMVGRGSLWETWRKELPSGEDLLRAVLERFRVWGETLDPDISHSRATAQFSLQIYDQLDASGVLPKRQSAEVPPRDLLYVAAVTHAVGQRPGSGAGHKRARRMLQKLDVPPGWTERDLLIAALVARYHRGALPATQSTYASLSTVERHLVDCLAGILRLADSLAGKQDGRVGGITVAVHAGAMIEIVAEAYRPRSKQAERIAAQRHLLEDACGIAIALRAARTQDAQTAIAAPGKA